MKKYLLLLVLALLTALPLEAASLRLSDLGAGGNFSSATSDKVVTVRNGGGVANPDVLTTLACSSLTNAAASCSTDTTTTANITDSLNKRFMTDANRTVLNNTSGTNTGDQVVPANTTGTASNWFSAYNSATGAFTKSQPACSDLSGVAASCSTDATNATNIGSGTLPAGRLPNPSATTLGGIESFAAVSNQWINTISTSGVPSATQPATTNLSDIGSFNLSTSGTITTSNSPTASTSAVTVNGTILTGGTGTTNFPMTLLAPSGATAPTTWNTSGTLLGLNTPSAFGGLVIDVKTNGGTTSLMTLNRFGAVQIDNALTAKGLTVNSTLSSINAGLTATGTVKLTDVIVTGGTKFTTTGCSVSATTGGETTGTYTSGTSGTCTVTITMNGATGLTAPTGWACFATDLTTALDASSTVQTATTTTTATLAGTTVSGDVVSFNCTGY